MKKLGYLLAVAYGLGLGAAPLGAHCEIPCGIYDDEARFEAMKEDAKTIEKSIHEILDLSKNPGKNANQLVRWIMNKDKHADQIKETVAFYFLSQRIKAPKSNSKKDVEAYHQKLVQLHEITVAAMKTKQTADPEWARKLTKAIENLETAYFQEHGHKHGKK